MRYEKAEKLFRIALAMQASAEGLSLQDIERDFAVGRRTAERVRAAIEALFPALQQVNPGEIPKRWRLPAGTTNGLVSFSAEELASLSAAAALLRRENMGEHANAFARASEKLRALLRPPALARIAPDLEALTEAEGLALRPGPWPNIDGAILAALRQAILGCRKVRLHYLYRVSGKRGHQVVHPYGFLYGGRHFLVAWNESERARDFRNYALANIERVEVLDAQFRRRKFSLQEYAEESFGLFREPAVDVVWKFSPKAAADAGDYVFHPTQMLEPQKDGSLIVRFRAGGLREMAWHAITWVPEIEIIAPKRLRAIITEIGEAAASARAR